MIFAPVIIPTLNRYEHFRKCLESLEACTGAEKTDVYVALDFPPSEKYVEGWKINMKNIEWALGYTDKALGLDVWGDKIWFGFDAKDCVIEKL